MIRPPLSVLDLAPITVGSTAAQALRNSIDLARHVEPLGYRRYWLAEHHNMTGIASAATAVVIGQVAAATSSMRIGAGGVMLPNHAPLVVAEQFGTLAALFPGRIDLGLGRAPGTDMPTVRALRRHLDGGEESFPRDVVELQSYFRPARPDQQVQAVPGAGLEVPIWLLGSSLYGARLAAHLGLPFAFAAHFAPRWLMQALDEYRSNFRPSPALERPFAMVAVNAVAADSDEEAQFLFTSMRHLFARLARGERGPLAAPDPDESGWTASERAFVDETVAYSLVGSAETIQRDMSAVAEKTGADEIMLSGHIFDHAARKRSFEIIAEAWHLVPQ